MKVLFVTISGITTLQQRGLYQDLLRHFVQKGHEVTVIAPSERRNGKPTRLLQFNNHRILSVRTLNLQKTNNIEKGIGQILLDYQFKKAFQKYFKNEHFDLILYSTPPITFIKTIQYIKNKTQAPTYLLLKDIFPQNAVDMGFIKKSNYLYKFFRNKEHKLYKLSDTIGCMSEANRQYIINHNPLVDRDKVEVNPNTIQPISFDSNSFDRKAILEKYKIPYDKKIFVYGGNLGKPQGLDFLIKTIETCKNIDAFFLIVGNGTQFKTIENWFDQNQPDNALLLSRLPKDDYDQLLYACDIGLIFLHPDFTIPNFPSRLLSYLEMSKPIIAATDTSTDIGQVIENAGCGYWVKTGDIAAMCDRINLMLENESKYKNMQKNALHLLEEQYLVDYGYQKIMNRIQSK